MDKDQWERLSPLLDELLDGDVPTRISRLESLRETSSADAGALQDLLDRLDPVEREGFLEGPLLGRGTGPGHDMLHRSMGPYTIERLLGQGGMGSVWLARRTDGQFDGLVAIKLLSHVDPAQHATQRFAREGRVLARLDHPNIARLIDAGVTAEGQRFLVLEYVDGDAIDRYCERHALDLRSRLKLLLDVMAAVAHAHNRLILHRDLKPSNILVTPAGKVKLLDFGVAKLLTETGPTQPSELTQQAGAGFTPAYAAPEQVTGGEVTTATDVYALGVMLFQLLSGVHPTASAQATPLHRLKAVAEVEPQRLSDAAKSVFGDVRGRAKWARALRGDLDNICARALKKSPAARYANAAEFAADLRRYLNHEPVAARGDSLAYRLGKFVRRERAGVSAVVGIVLALLLGTGVALQQAHEVQQQRAQAEGLVEFMLGDLRKQLQPVGRLDVLDAVGVRALSYYAVQDPDKLDADALGRRSRALHLIGEIAERRGHLDEASRVFQQAQDSTGLLLARSAGDGQRLFDHSQSVYWVGYVARQRGRLEEAHASFQRYAELVARLLVIDPGNVDWQIENGYAGINLGVVHLESWRPAEALQAFTKANETWERIVAHRPELRVELGNTLGWIGQAREALGDLDGAIQAQQAKIDVLQQLPNAKDDPEVLRLLSHADYEISLLQASLGRLDAAERIGRRGLSRLESLVQRDETNAEWQTQMVFARANLADIALAQGRAAAALTQWQRANNELTATQSDNSGLNRYLVKLRGALLVQQARLGLSNAVPVSSDPLLSFTDAVQRMQADGASLNREQALTMAAVEIATGDVLAREGSAETGRHWRAAAAHLPQDAGDLTAMTLKAQALLRLGSVAEARVLAGRLDASPYRHPLYADLRQRLPRAAGTAAATSSERP